VVETRKSAADRAGGLRSRTAAPLLGVAIAAVMWCGNDPAGAAEAPRLSFLVAPFANLSGDAAQDYLADILTDETTTVLARLPNSLVIARNTAFADKGQPADAKAIGKELGVRYVLGGSVRPSGDQVRVAAELVDAESGARVWGEQFDAPRADLLRLQDEIVARLAPTLTIQPADLNAARLKRKPSSNPAAEDFALRCTGAVERGRFIGPDGEVTFRLCQQALDADPANVRALSYLSLKFWFPVGLGRSADPKSDLAHADQLASQALALDPDYAPAHTFKASILELETHTNEAIVEDQRALALDPSTVDAYAHLGWTYLGLGQFDKSEENFNKAVRLSPRDPGLGLWSSGALAASFGLKHYDQAIEWARQAIAINPRNVFAHGDLIAAFALSGRDAEAHEALDQYLALPLTGVGTIGAFKAFLAQVSDPNGDPRIREGYDRTIEGLRKAGMPE
jgi:adenylate cyclase